MNEWQEKQNYSEETGSSVAMSTTDPTLQLGRAQTRAAAETPVTNHLSYGTLVLHLISSNSVSATCSEFESLPINVSFSLRLSNGIVWAG
jgi:hypothetical protein